MSYFGCIFGAECAYFLVNQNLLRTDNSILDMDILHGKEEKEAGGKVPV